MVGSCFHQISGDRAMITLKSILVPTDFSKQSQSAIRYGIEFAKKFGATLHVLHVVQDVSIFIPEMGFINPSAALSNIEPMLLAAGKSLADFLEPYKHHGIELISHCQEGNPIFPTLPSDPMTNRSFRNLPQKAISSQPSQRPAFLEQDAYRPSSGRLNQYCQCQRESRLLPR